MNLAHAITMRLYFPLATLLAAALLSACVGGKSTTAPSSVPAVPTLNTLAVNLDSGPAAATGQVNHAYVTLKVCAAGSQSQCANIDHVLLDTGSVGLRLVRSVLTAGAVTLSAETDTSGRTIEECVSFVGGQTWGPVAEADVTLAGESAAKLPVQVLDDTSAGAPPPPTCGANGTLINSVAGFGANGVLGVGALKEDCGSACVNAATPLAVYYGCTSAGTCTAENVVLASQVTNPVAMFAADNNGLIINLPKLVNANGDATLQGEMIFGLATQSDNAIPAAGITVLGADANGDFTANYQGSATNLTALIDSGTDSYTFNDPAIPVCGTSAGIFQGYYCPNPAPKSVSVVNTGRSGPMASSTVDFAIADPMSFVAGAAAFGGLASVGGLTIFTYGMPFFYGRKIYIGIDQRVADIYTGPYYAY